MNTPFRDMSREQLLANTDLIGSKINTMPDPDFTYKEWVNTLCAKQEIPKYEWRQVGKNREGIAIFQTNHQSFRVANQVCSSMGTAEMINAIK